jgi:hypothetical protein
MAPVLTTAKGEQGYRAIERAWVQIQLVLLKERVATGYVSPLDFARVYAQLGEADLAFKHLEEAFEHRAPGLVFLKVDRAWDAVRKDPRFDNDPTEDYDRTSSLRRFSSRSTIVSSVTTTFI